MDERMLLVSEYLRGEKTMASICEAYGVSRKTGYKWVQRYGQYGPEGLTDQSRAPQRHPNRLDAAIVEQLIEARKARPHWGARKILAWLAKKKPTLALPAPSTVSALYSRHGLSRRRQPRRRTSPYTEPFADADAPNRVWCADFKGDFYTGDRTRCYPLTITDAHSRMLLCCRALRSTKTVTAMKVFEEVFRKYGMPDCIRTDNGTPFSSRAPAGLSELSVWWVKLGIRHERIEPGRPDQNGRHERMHRTLKEETLRPPARTFQAQQRRFDVFRKDYNEERPHEALQNVAPDSIYVPSSRPLPRRLAQIAYPDDFVTKQLSECGRFRWCSKLVVVSRVLAGELIGIKEDGAVAHVYFSDVHLGTIDSKRLELGLIRPPPTTWARTDGDPEYRPTRRRSRGLV